MKLANNDPQTKTDIQVKATHQNISSPGIVNYTSKQRQSLYKDLILHASWVVFGLSFYCICKEPSCPPWYRFDIVMVLIPVLDIYLVDNTSILRRIYICIMDCNIMESLSRYHTRKKNVSANKKHEVD